MGGVFVIGDAVDIAVIGPAACRSVSGMEVIRDGKNGLAGRSGRHGERLETLVQWSQLPHDLPNGFASLLSN